MLLDQGFAVESRNEIGETLLICAARSAQSQIVDILLRRGASVAARDDDKNTALIAACRHHSVDSAKLLLAAGADIEAENKDGETPLLISIQGFYRVPLYLIQQGANVHVRNSKGQGLLELCKNFEEKLRTPLLEAGAIE